MVCECEFSKKRKDTLLPATKVNMELRTPGQQNIFNGVVGGREQMLLIGCG